MSNFTEDQVRKLTHLSARYGFSYDDIEASAAILLEYNNESFERMITRLDAIAANFSQFGFTELAPHVKHSRRAEYAAKVIVANGIL